MSRVKSYNQAKLISKKFNIPLELKWPKGSATQWKNQIKKINNKNETNNLNEFFRNPKDEAIFNIENLSVEEALNKVKLKKDFITFLRIGNKSTKIQSKRHIARMKKFVEKSLIELKEGEGSDYEAFAELNQNPDLKPSIKLVKIENARREGAFFPYTHKLENVNLEKYDIYHKVPEKYEMNCLEKALLEGGLPNDKFTKLKTLMKQNKDGRYVKTKDLKTIAEILDIHINLNQIILDSNNRTIHYNKKSNRKTYKIALLEKHYFINDKTNYTKYSIENYEEVKDIHNFNEINEKNRSGIYQKNKNRFLNSVSLIKLLLKHKDTHLTPININEHSFDIIDFNQVSDYKNLTELESDFIKSKNYDITPLKEGTKIVYFDFEATTDEDIHKPYQIWYYTRCGKKNYFEGLDCAVKFLRNISKLGKNVLCIAHNLRYDLQFLIKFLSNARNMIKSGSRIKQIEGSFNKTNLKFKDSLAIISMPLKSFSKCFNLETYKDVMPYEAYNKNTIGEEYIPLEEGLQYLETDEEKKQFLENLNENNLLINNNYWNHMEYSSIYCEKDVKILKEGYEIFREWMLEVANIDIDLIVSIPQLANKYGLDRGCFEGVYKLSGIPRDFIQRCVEGGRVMTANNKKIIININNQDFDATNLYGSSMARMKGFLKGKPKIIPSLMSIDELMKQDGYFIEINIKEVGKKLNFPLISYKNDEGIRVYTNEPCKMYVDKTKLEDLIKYQKIKFEFVRGYYFNEGWNNKVNEIIKFLFNERLEKKKQKNPIQQVYKLIMNAFYGKLIMKPIDNKYSFVYGEKKINKFIDYHHNSIKSFVNISDNMIMFEEVKSINEHFSMPHCGVEVLSMSKRIMNEVMCLAEDLNIEMYYTDTDSIHIEENGINKLAEEYFKIHNRELIGKNLGQFHCDFDFKSDEGTLPVAVQSIFLGKKSYLDKVKTIENGAINYHYHIRLKGIPKKCILNHKNGEDVMTIYKNLYDGKKYTFDLLKAVKFKSNTNFTMSNHKAFEREVKF